MKHRTAFTLIELLIVVLIIAILASIAVPNFLEFQTRAKVARAKSDLRTMATGVEAYLVDNNVYPLDGDDIEPFNPFVNYNVFERLKVITTPVAYIGILPEDPFHLSPVVFNGSQFLFPNPPPYTYIYNTFGSFDPAQTFSPGPDNNGQPDNYGLSSLGPSQIFDSADPLVNDVFPRPFFYDPTNGTVSPGDLHYLGGARHQ